MQTKQSFICLPSKEVNLSNKDPWIAKGAVSIKSMGDKNDSWVANGAIPVKPKFVEEEEQEFKPDKSLKRAFARTGRDLAASLGDAADIPYIVADAARYASVKGARALGANVEDTEFGKWVPNFGHQIANKIDEATGGYTAPQDDTEKNIEAATRALGTLPLGFGTGATVAKYAPKAGKFLKTMFAPTAENAAATAAGAAGSQAILNEDPENQWGALAAGLASGTSAGVGVKGLKHVAKHGPSTAVGSVIGKAFKINPEKLEKMGTVPSTLADISDSPNAAIFENSISWAPGASYIMKKFRQNQGKQIRENLAIGENPIDKDSAGVLVQKSANKIKSDHNVSQNALDEIIENSGAKNELVNAENTLNFVPERIAEYPTQAGQEFFRQFTPWSAKISDALIDMANETLEKKTVYSPAKNASKKTIKVGGKPVDFDSLNIDLQDQINKVFEEAVEAIAEKTPKKSKPSQLQEGAKTMNFKELLLVKRKIGSIVKNFGKTSNIPEGELKMLYGQIKKDFDAHFLKIGGEGQKAWNKFNADEVFYKTHHQDFINDLTDLKNNPKASFEYVAANGKGDKQFYNNAYKGLDNADQKNLLTAFMENLGAGKGQEWSIFEARKQFLKKSPGERNALLAPLTDEERRNFLQTLDAIGQINAKKLFENTSGTTHTAQFHKYTQAAKDIGLGTLGVLAGQTAMAAKIAPAALLLLAPIGGAALFTNQRFLRWAAQSVKKTNAVQYGKHLQKFPELDLLPQNVINQIKESGHQIVEENKKPQRLHIQMRKPKD